MNHIKTKEQLDHLTSLGPTVVKFFAPWCGPCRSMTPVVKELAEDNPNVIVVECNIDKASDLASTYGVSAIPSIKFFAKGGSLVNTVTGIAGKSELQSQVDKL